MKRENSGDPEEVKRPKLTDDEELLRFQKEAILLQMKEYKRKYQTCCSTIEELNLKIEDLQEENIKLSTTRSDPEKEQKPEDIKIVHLKEKVADLTAKLESYTDEIDRLNKKIDRINLNKSKVDNMTSSEQGFVDQSQLTKERDKSAAGEASLEEIQDLKYQISLRDEDLVKAEKEISHLSLTMKQSQIDMKVLRQSLERQKEFERELKSMINEHELKVQNQQLSDQVQLLQQSRREYQQLVKDEEEKKRKILEADLKKNNQELTRLRANRDHLAKTVESLKSKTQDGELSHLKSLVEARKLRIDFLESELIRLKTCVAADSGEAGLLKFLEAGIENPYKQLNSDLEVAKLKIKQFESGTTNDTNVKQIKMLQDVISRYTALYGELSENPLDSKSILEKTTAELDILKTKLSQKEKSEQRLMQELETLGTAWSTLEKQYTSSTPALDENKNIAEKQKLEQKLLVYQKQNSSFNNTYKAQKSQFEKQLEQIRKLEEVEKNHLSQIVFFNLPAHYGTNGCRFSAHIAR